MSETQLPVPAFNLVIALVHERGRGTIADFKAAAGPKEIKKDTQEVLVERGLVTIDRDSRPFVYELTDAGWLAARQLLRGRA